jgi:hypothetical protein
MDLLAVRFFSPTTAYNIGDFVQQAGQLYCANVAITAGAFNPAQWAKVTLASDIGTMASQNANAVAITGGTINGASGAFTTLSATGTATFSSTLNVTGAILAYSDVTLNTGNLVLNAPAPGGLFYFYDRGTGGGNRAAYSYLYRDGNNTVLNSSDNCGIFLYGAAVVDEGNLTVNGVTSLAGLTVTAGTPASQGTSSGWYCNDRDGTGKASMLYGTADLGRLWRSDVGDCFTFGPAGACVVGGTLTVNTTLTVSGSTITANNLVNAGCALNSPSGLALIVSGTHGLIQQNVSARAWYTGPYNDGNWRANDASSGHEHIRFQYTNNGCYVNDVITAIGDYGAFGYGTIMTSTVNGVVAWGFTAMTQIAGYIDYYARVDSTASNLMWTGYGTTNVGTITTNGSACFYNSACDAKLKDNVRPLVSEIDVGAIIDAIAPVRFEWNSTPDHPTDVGFIAQDLHQVVPNVVTPGRAGVPCINHETGEEEVTAETVWQADTSKLIPYLVAELQALRQRVKFLESHA